ncbi:hypothetical protein [Pleionea sp. CnH1-48]|uniref:hypothetical protein n=1 Tax=Pleionea sp. CnH1-48 TaxID=2954494 RepID=UPI002096AD53|nr:hypothetical protein [Pleionea sp. CnH1-48]MCO7226719.1 hypothetical protein [Pleionea sp. CnH1-48]
MANKIKTKYLKGLEVMEREASTELWAVVANIRRDIPYGPGGKEIRNGTNQFRGGAKVHIIGAYFGMCESIIAVGQHCKTGKYVRCVIRANAIENMRVKKIYSRSIWDRLDDYQPTGASITVSKEEAENLMKCIPIWCELYF